MIAATHRLLLVLLVLAACGAQPSATASPMQAPQGVDAAAASQGEHELYQQIASDPAFAGWKSCWQQLRETTSLEFVGDDAAWQQFASERAAKHDEAALAIARELVAHDCVAAFARFAASPAGQSLALAEGRAHAMAWNMLEVPTGTLARFRDREQVGDVAREQFLETVERIRDKTNSASPAQLALTIAAIAITPEQADAIDAFHRTEDGKAWLAVRDAARKQTRERVVAVRGEAIDRGLAKDLSAGFALPKAQFAEPESPR
jgi:hypothetical protein